MKKVFAEESFAVRSAEPHFL